MSCKGFLLIEICFSILFLGLLSGLLFYFVSIISTHAVAIDRSIEALFLARSSFEEYRASKKSLFRIENSPIFSMQHSFTSPIGLEGFHTLEVAVSWKEGSSVRSVSLKGLVPQK